MNSNRQPGLSDATIGVEFDKAVKYTYSDLIPMLGLIRKITNIFFAYFLQFVGMRQQTNHHQSWLRQTRYLPMINRSSAHQNQHVR